jgi:uncharacterized phage protein gp47/JayE
MAITTKSFTELVRDQVTAIQGASKLLVDLTIGSILRAIVEANAAVVIWLEGLILQMLAMMRASTSSGADLDSWVNDFGLSRLSAIAASGLVNFSRFSSTIQAVIPIGVSVQTSDGTQTYTVVLDTNNTAYSASLNAYVLATGVPSINLLVVASAAGAAGNAQAGNINTLTTPITGVDTVTNALTFINGVDAESDTALRARFISFVASLSKATKSAVGYAITSLQQGITYTLVENLDYSGNVKNGYFYVVVDDGTGSPTSTLLNTVANAIETVRPLAVTFGVFPPVVIPVTVSMTLTIANGYNVADTKANAQAAIQSYINSLALGQPLTYTRISQIAYDSSDGIINVSNITLNDGAFDIAVTNKNVIKSATVLIGN